jgi:copper chaperone CopZ
MQTSKKARAILRLQEKSDDDSSHQSRVEQILNKTEGVFRVDINHLTNVLSVEYDPNKINLGEIKQFIEKARVEARSKGPE